MNTIEADGAWPVFSFFSRVYCKTGRRFFTTSIACSLRLAPNEASTTGIRAKVEHSLGVSVRINVLGFIAGGGGSAG